MKKLTLLGITCSAALLVQLLLGPTVAAKTLSCSKHGRRQSGTAAHAGKCCRR